MVILTQICLTRKQQYDVHSIHICFDHFDSSMELPSLKLI